MISRTLAPLLRQHLSSDAKKVLRHVQRWCIAATGYSQEHWVRVVQRRQWHEFLSEQSCHRPRVLEISPGDASPWRRYATGSYSGSRFPDFDICGEALQQKFDIIIAEQVFEHLPNPDSAARNVRAMISDNGVFLIATPFLIKVHGPPDYGDFMRWTSDGLALFLKRNGFSRVEAYSWGNRRALRRNLREWVEFGWWRDLRNEPEFPITIWAYARP